MKRTSTDSFAAAAASSTTWPSSFTTVPTLTSTACFLVSSMNGYTPDGFHSDSSMETKLHGVYDNKEDANNAARSQFFVQNPWGWTRTDFARESNDKFVSRTKNGCKEYHLSTGDGEKWSVTVEETVSYTRSTSTPPPNPQNQTTTAKKTTTTPNSNYSKSTIQLLDSLIHTSDSDDDEQMEEAKEMEEEEDDEDEDEEEEEDEQQWKKKSKKSSTSNKKEESAAAEAEPLWGKVKCRASYASGKACTHGAYFIVGKTLLCGQHSKGQVRRELKRPSASDKRTEQEAHQAGVDEATAANKKEGKCGRVTLFRMGMRRAVQNRIGFKNIFPNYRHGGRTDGLGLPTLSPMVLGPVKHGQVGLPDGLNLENVWQFSKQFHGESDEAFLATQKQAFLDPEPHRHKQKLKEGEPKPHWIWVCPVTGKRHRLGWIEARQFYCNWYERLVRQQPEWLTLKKMVQEQGVNVQLCGYDAVTIGEEGVEAAYLSTAAPFGHERVLLAMLTISNEANWPWRKHKTFEF